jgi:membrane-associated phospholipid phosphatase
MCNLRIPQTRMLSCDFMLRRALERLRPEEGLLVIGFIASAAVTIYANVDVARQGIDSRKIQGGLLRLAIVILLATLLPFLERYLRRRAGTPRALGAAEFFRTMLPFLMCIAVYTNLHDTVRYVNPHDIHQYLAAIEERIFGGQPVIWAERYITPARTEFFNFFYANFYLVAPSVVAVLWFSGRKVASRQALLGIILCFYSGYLLYIIFPAAPPRLYFESLGLFTVTLRGGPITNFQDALIQMMPNHAARAAFPSLHSAVSILALYYAWKYCRWFFPILLTFVIGLLVSTVYLRHHWVVDLLAGVPLVPWAQWFAPRFEGWWTARVQGSRCVQPSS